MRFSYDLIKKMVPKAESMDKVMHTLTMHTMPAEDPRGKTFDAELPSNRYADLASHTGIAREYAAASGKKLEALEAQEIFPLKSKGEVDIDIKSKEDCPRYAACVFEFDRQGKTPKWMVDILKDCGLRPISSVVDILNYVMLETGQPMHAFDLDKLEGGIVVRKAKEGEKITTIDNQSFKLSKEDLVIADHKSAQAIAGIKGGKAAEVSASTKKILVEAANFNQVLIYKTSKRLKLPTDASARFSHGISPYSVEEGIERAAVLLREVMGARLVGGSDTYLQKPTKKFIGFNVEKFNSLTGLNLTKAKCLSYLQALGFKKATRKSVSKKDDFIVEIPPLRLDIEIFEDLVEEVLRMAGIDDLAPVAPHVSIQPAVESDMTTFKDRVRNILTAINYNEVYSTSFVGKGDSSAYEVENPLAEHRNFLRQRITDNLEDALKENSKYFDTVRVFELGGVFDKKLGERVGLGIAIKGKIEDSFLELRGAVEQMLVGLGFAEFTIAPDGSELLVEVDGDRVGSIKHTDKHSAVAEFNATKLMELEEGEFEYRPISKYPSVMRDISLALKEEVRVGDILNAIESVGAKHAIDVELIDYYDPRHLTFRIVFQSDNRTLEDDEVTKEFDKIVAHLKKKFPFEIR